MDTKTLALILALLGALSVVYNETQTKPELSDFETWKLKFGVFYESMFENAYRERIFLENIAKIELHNRNQNNSYRMGVNQFTALTQNEFIEMYLGTIVPTEIIDEEKSQEIKYDIDHIDWREKEAVTGVKDQGKCGSCWAFSTTGALEGLSQLSYGSLQSFSEQQLIDCSGSYGNNGCNGGLMDNAFKYVKAKGIVHQNEYPYQAVQQTCIRDGGSFKISGFVAIKSCNNLIFALLQRPVSVTVDATNWSSYSSGVFDNCATSLNHGVLLIGYSEESWVVKNSWGATWGENGYIRLTGALKNTCGICNSATLVNK